MVATYLEYGLGTPKDEVGALSWYYLASTWSDHKDPMSQAALQSVIMERGLLENQIPEEWRLVAQQRCQELAAEVEQAKEALVRGTPASDGLSAVAADQPKASGSGVFVSPDGFILTAAHVVADSQRLKIITARGSFSATVVAVDRANDLAVLKADNGAPFPALAVGSSRGVRLGAAVATIGFPEPQIQGFSPKVTRGEISSLAGEGDDPRTWQISVPVQAGNSGGPLLDRYGNVIGIIVSKLGLKVAQATGDLPENVNYAVKADYAAALVGPYLTDPATVSVGRGPPPAFEDMVAKVQDAMVMVLCY